MYVFSRLGMANEVIKLPGFKPWCLGSTAIDGSGCFSWMIVKDNLRALHTFRTLFPNIFSYCGSVPEILKLQMLERMKVLKYNTRLFFSLPVQKDHFKDKKTSVYLHYIQS
jgi:hypothetical protein